MPKIVGIIVTWNNLPFFKFALEQALDFCDEVLLAEGCHSKKFNPRSTDGTYEFIDSYPFNKKLKIFKFVYNRKNSLNKKSYVGLQWYIRQELLRRSSLPVNGNTWLRAWDDDMFFFNNDLLKIKECMSKTKSDHLKFKERRFIFNFKVCTKPSVTGSFYRLSEGCFYKPLMKLCYKSGSYYRDSFELIPSVLCHHYCYVKTLERAKARWLMSAEKGYTSNIEYYNIFKNTKIDNIAPEPVEKILGSKNLEIYNGNHPEVLKDHGWRNLFDVRRV